MSNSSFDKPAAAKQGGTAKKPMSIWENHPFHYHISFFMLPPMLVLLLGYWIFAWTQLSGVESVDALAGVGWRLFGGFLVAAGLAALAAWQVSLIISSRLNILKEQAAVIRVLDFETEIPLDTPIREIFGLGRAMRQMKNTIQKFMRVSLALSGERDFDKLLGRVLHEMREALDGNGGATYLYDEDEHKVIVASQRWGKDGRVVPEASGSVMLGDPSHPVCAAFTGADSTSIHTIEHPRPEGMEYLDQRYGEAPVLMVAVPLRASDSSPIGIVCNFTDANLREPSRERIVLAEAFSAAAAVAIDQNRLLEAQEKLMDGMIEIMAGAIDAKSPYTGGHCLRVPELGMMLAEEACEVKEGPFKDFAFESEDEWREFRIGAWLHDCGKVTTPEYVVDKATKLETIHNRIHEIRGRFEILLRDAKVEHLEAVAAGADASEAQAAFEARKAALVDDYAFIAECNVGGEFMAPERVERLRQIGGQEWLRHFDDRLGLSFDELKRFEGEPPQLPVTEKLLDDKEEHIVPRTDERILDPKWGFKVEVPEHLYNRGELHNLSVARGTLTEEERFKINEHVIHSLMMLEQLPLPKNLRRVPEYAGTHHETLTGTGYPRKLEESQLSIPMRIMAIADIFEALTAADRPYKKAKTLSESVKILSFFKKDRHIDGELFDLFLTSGVYLKYAERFLLPEQMDDVDVAQYVG